jgi:probable rRNA maturation factor
MSVLDIQNETRRTIPARSLFTTIAQEVLPGWDISLVFVGPAKARALNQKLRKKNYVPNVLSYEAGEKSGEIIICPHEADKQAPTYGMDKKRFILFLFIHGVLHIKGWAHGATMEAWEQKLLARFAPFNNGAKNSNRHRHRNLPNKSGGRRRID